MDIVSLPTELLEKISAMEKEAYSFLVIGAFNRAEKVYQNQHSLLINEEEKLDVNQKYHKGAALHNWGVSLLFQKKLLEGFNKIVLAYIEDLLNSPQIEDALNAPAYKTLRSYPLISEEFLDQIKEAAAERRNQHNEPRNPREILAILIHRDIPDLPSRLTPERTRETPLTKKQMRVIIKGILKKLGKKKNRVFIGGSYKNIALLRYIQSIVEEIDGLKGVLSIDLPGLSSDKFDHLVHDMSMELLKGCSYAIFEVSVSNGHLMEIEWVVGQKKLSKKALLFYQQTTKNKKPPITRMVMTTKLKKWSYKNFKELRKKIKKFL